MVCRENKGRSAMMGMTKHLMRARGNGETLIDAEAQSTAHELKHSFDALNMEAPTTVEEQIDFMKRVRQEVADMDDIPESEKYRKSQRRPGIVTRLDQEIKRLETGTHESGEPLTEAQKNNAAHMASMMRMGQVGERTVPARERFLENNARHRGISYEDARAEWNGYMKEEGHFESRSKIRDDVRASLATAGVDPATQTDLGVSGRAVRAMELMEEKRREAVSRLESHPAVTERNKLTSYVSSTSSAGKIQCKRCGQFGHEEGSCPNTALKAEADKIAAQRQELDQLTELKQRYDMAKNMSDAELKEKLQGVKDVDQWRQQTLKEAEEAYDRGEWLPADAERRYAALDRSEKKINAEMERNSSGVYVNDEVSEVRYNRQTGLLVINRHPDADGNEQPARVYRCTESEASQVAHRLKEEKLDTVEQAVLSGDGHQFANPGDAEAALSIVKCPTCGQWASMNSSHQCPVEGGPSEQLEHERRRKRIEEQRRRREALAQGRGEEARLTRRNDIVNRHRSRNSHIDYRDENGNRQRIQLSEGAYGHLKHVSKAVDNGEVAVTGVGFDFADGKVTGKATVWADKSGRRYVSVHDTGMSDTGMKCDCTQYQANGNCKHMRAAEARLSVVYGQNNQDMRPPRPAMSVRDGVLPGEDPREGRMAPDVLELDAERPGVNRLLAQKQKRLDGEMEQFKTNRANGQGATTLMVQGPTDSDGNPTEWPTHWQPTDVDDDGEPRRAQAREKVTDLNDDGEVADRFRTLMSNRKATMPDGSTERIKYGAKMSTIPGGVTISLPKKYANASPQRRRAAENALAEHLGVPRSAVTSKGYFIPANTATYSEFLDKASRNHNNISVRGPRTIAVSSAEEFEAARRANGPGGR